MFYFFFFKQKTAYEMRISDWSSDVCSSDLLVATVMSNLGLERFLKGEGIDLVRTKVGDRYVLEQMRAGGYNVGGEQSGHMILSDHATTGDGTIAALQVLAAVVQSGKPASEVLHQFDPVPQLLKNVRYASGKPLENPARSEEHTSELQSIMRI